MTKESLTHDCEWALLLVYMSMKRMFFWTFLCVCAMSFVFIDSVFAQTTGLTDLSRYGGSNHCGDGMLKIDLGEMCDDGNYIDADGCSGNCKTENDQIVSIYIEPFDPKSVYIDDTTYYKVFSTNEDDDTQDQPSVIENDIHVCGDGIVNHIYEWCDDGNTANDDGCSEQCKIEDISVTVVRLKDTPRSLIGHDLVPLELWARQVGLTRTSTLKKGIGVDQPYPSWLSNTWTNVYVSSRTLFILLLLWGSIVVSAGALRDLSRSK